MQVFNVVWQHVCSFWEAVARPLLTSGPFILLLLVFFYRRRVGELLKHVKTLEVGGNLITFGQSDADMSWFETLPAPSVWRKSRAEREASLKVHHPLMPSEKGKDNTRTPLPRVQWENTGNLFWLGHDLMWTMQAAMRGADKQTIVHGLNHCCYHSWGLGLQSSHPGRHLDQLESDVDHLSEKQLDREWRKSFAQGMNNLIFDMGSIAMENQPGYESDVVPRKDS